MRESRKDTSRWHELISLLVCRQFAPRAADAVGWKVPPERHHVTASACDRQPVAREWEGIEAVDSFVDFLQRNIGVGLSIQRHMNVDLSAALAGMAEMEIERHGVEELKLLVILEQMALLHAAARRLVGCQQCFEAGLARLLVSE